LNPVCPYCRTEVGESEGERKDCPGCGTPHHSDCFAENGGCTVFGCSEAPADEAKVTVTATDMMGNTVARQVTPAQPAASLGSGFATFRAPAAGLPPQPPAASPAAPPPPPPPMAGTGVAPPPQLQQTRVAVAGIAPPQLVNYYQTEKPKTRVIFVLLGIFLGIFGAHNFYAGYTKKGGLQLVTTILTVPYAAIIAWLWAVVWVWAIIEICLVNKDADGTQFV